MCAFSKPEIVVGVSYTVEKNNNRYLPSKNDTKVWGGGIETDEIIKQ